MENKEARQWRACEVEHVKERMLYIYLQKQKHLNRNNWQVRSCPK